MPRRLALATSFAFTLVVTCLLVAIGSSSGFLGGREAPAQPAAQIAGEEPEIASVGAPGPFDAEPGATATPIVVTRIVYEDDAEGETVAPAARAPSPSRTPTSAKTPRPAPSPSPPAFGAAAATSTPAPRSTATPPAPNAPPPTVAPPTYSPPAATATAPPAATQRPGGNATPAEIEFVATITGINGDMVSFSNGRVVKVSSGLSRLGVGTRAHVEARLQGGVYVAKEIEGA